MQSSKISDLSFKSNTKPIKTLTLIDFGVKSFTFVEENQSRTEGVEIWCS